MDLIEPVAEDFPTYSFNPTFYLEEEEDIMTEELSSLVHNLYLSQLDKMPGETTLPCSFLILSGPQLTFKETSLLLKEQNLSC